MAYKQESIKPYSPKGEKGKQVEQMFDNIAHSYDLLNHCLSLGIDKSWRRAAIESLRAHQPQRILDVATGTGDFALLSAQMLRPKQLLGIDISEGMLEVGRKKVAESELESVISFKKDDCMQLSLASGEFDAVTVAYGIRNFENLDKGLREMRRVLRPGGRLVIIELTAPQHFPMKQLFWVYSHLLMPALGRLISKDKQAYSYLPATMEAFPQGEIMADILKKAGFENVAFKRFTFGLSTLYTASAPLEKEEVPFEKEEAPLEKEEASNDIYGLAGYPLGHSFSAKFFAEKFQKEGISAAYKNYEVPDIQDMKKIVAENPRLRGFNVTIPHKQNIFSLLDEISKEAKAIGAVNVVKIVSDKNKKTLKGFNTDCVGFTESLRPMLKTHHRRALVLGTGGASKAIVYALKQLNIEPTLVSRKRQGDVLCYEDLDEKVMDTHTLIVNCSPVGTHPNTEECPNIPYHLLTERHLLYDLVYNPDPTLFMQRGIEKGCAVKSGWEMLQLQALAAWDIWNDKRD